MQPISHSTSTYIFKQDYILLTTLSINGVSDFVVEPRMRNPETLLISAYLPDFFIPMVADLGICCSSVGLNSKQRWPDRVFLTWLLDVKLTQSITH